jgi:hypothetical protein
MSTLAQTGQSLQRRLSLALYSRAPQFSHVQWGDMTLQSSSRFLD